MKKIIISTLLICVAFVSCKNEKAKEKTEDVVVTEVSTITDGSYITNVENSTLNWRGFKPTGTHNGTVNIKEGNLTVADGKLVGGNFVFDMSTITVLDIPAEDEYNGKLVGHLSNPDFFDVEKNPTTTFEIVEVVYGDNTSVKGNLTIKGITKSIEFPVVLANTDTGLELEGVAFKIDRTDFDIKYKSQKFFDDLKDKFINDEFEISFKVNATN